MNENIEEPAPRCPCGKRGRFKLYEGNGMMLCLDDMQYWLTQKLKHIKLHNTDRREKE